MWKLFFCIAKKKKQITEWSTKYSYSPWYCTSVHFLTESTVLVYAVLTLKLCQAIQGLCPQSKAIKSWSQWSLILQSHIPRPFLSAPLNVLLWHLLLELYHWCQCWENNTSNLRSWKNETFYFLHHNNVPAIFFGVLQAPIVPITQMVFNLSQLRTTETIP